MLTGNQNMYYLISQILFNNVTNLRLENNTFSKDIIQIKYTSACESKSASRAGQPDKIHIIHKIHLVPSIYTRGGSYRSTPVYYMYFMYYIIYICMIYINLFNNYNTLQRK